MYVLRKVKGDLLCPWNEPGTFESTFSRYRRYPLITTTVSMEYTQITVTIY